MSHFTAVAAAAAPALPVPAGCRVYFSPHGGCTEAAVSAIGAAKSELLIQGYGFTSLPIAQAVIAAFKRGVHVAVVLDPTNKNERTSQADELVGAGVPVYLDHSHPIAHNKVMIIDKAVVLTGSFNWTVQAEMNAENLVVVSDRRLAAIYAANWQRHFEHSEPYRPAPKAA